MSSKAHLGSTESQIALARRLEGCPNIAKHNDGDHREAWTLVYSLANLDSSFHRYLETDLPRVLETESCEDFDEAVADLRESLRQVVYHLWASKYFRILLGAKPDWISE
jgi:hypothetical protein